MLRHRVSKAQLVFQQRLEASEEGNEKDDTLGFRATYWHDVDVVQLRWALSSV